MRVLIIASFGALLLFVLFLSIDPTALSVWVIEQQRAFQDQMASAVRALRAGDGSAYLSLLLATGSYGFVHALGPGHGKYLVGGVGLGTGASARRLVAISAASSMLQAAWAVALVYGGFFLLEVTAQGLTSLAEDILAPVSYLAIGAVGLVLMWRGLAALVQLSRRNSFATEHGACCGHNHGPTHKQVSQLRSARETTALILSIAIRPCTGAIFLLVIAWQMDIKVAGAIAVLVMGLGTASLTSLVALSSVAARRLALVSADGSGLARVAFPAGQVLAGAMVFWISLGLLAIVL